MIKALTKLPDLKPFQIGKIKQIVPFFASIRTMKPVEAITFAESKMGFSEYLKNGAMRETNWKKALMISGMSKWPPKIQNHSRFSCACRSYARR